MESKMRNKLLGGVAALTLMGCAVLASVGPASAYERGWGWGPGAFAAGIVGGAVAAATSPLWAPGYYGYAPGYYNYAPGYYGDSSSGYYDNAPSYYDYAPGYAIGPSVAPLAPAGDSAGWCQARFRSYDPATGMYTGYDGMRHPCP
jgi:hypothetical protein